MNLNYEQKDIIITSNNKLEIYNDKLEMYLKKEGPIKVY